MSCVYTYTDLSALLECVETASSHVSQRGDVHHVCIPHEGTLCVGLSDSSID